MRILIAVVILLQVGLGVLYATGVPRWEAPDEPAHYNYVRHIAETGTLPELRPGDYDQALLEKLKADRFPPSEPIDSIRYESYQPPLYYLAAAPIYLAARAVQLDPVLSLRLFSVLLSALLLLLAYRVLSAVLASNQLLVAAGVGLMAALPMHVAMSSSVNADILAEVIIAILLLLSILRVQGQLSSDRRLVLWGGLVYGLALLVSTKAYAALVLLILAEVVYQYRSAARGGGGGREAIRRTLVSLIVLLAVALVISGWWFIRNWLLYGGLDVLGWVRHDAVVTGQPTTADWVAQYGLSRIAADFFIITFKSFWAQFGWMGVLVNDRIYVVLFVLTLAALFGAALWLIRIIRTRGDDLGATRWPWLLLGVWLVLVLAAHAWYNLRYIQPQGRYLFPALIPIAALQVVGVYELVDKRYARLIFGLLYALLLALDFVSLYWYIIPQLRG